MDHDAFVQAGLDAAQWCVTRYDDLYSEEAAVYEDPLVAAWFSCLGGTTGPWVPFVRADTCGEHDLVECVHGRLETVAEAKSWFRRPTVRQVCPEWDRDLRKLNGCGARKAIFALWVSHHGRGWTDPRDQQWRVDLLSWARNRSLRAVHEPTVTIDGRKTATSLWIWSLR